MRISACSFHTIHWNQQKVVLMVDVVLLPVTSSLDHCCFLLSFNEAEVIVWSLSVINFFFLVLTYSTISRVQIVQVRPLFNLQTMNKVTFRRSDVVSPPPSSPLCCVCSVVSSSLTPHRGFPVGLPPLALPSPSPPPPAPPADPSVWVQNGAAHQLFLQDMNN